MNAQNNKEAHEIKESDLANESENTDEGLGILKQKRRRKGPAERMWAPIKLKLNENYNYISKNWGIKFLYYFALIVGMPFLYLYYKIRWHFKVIGKENAKLLKKQAAVTVANHVHNIDAFMLTYVFYPKTPYFVALKHNFEAFIIGGLVRVMGGVPLPEEIKSFERFSEQINDVLKNTTRKVHIFPEGEIEPYAKKLRKFKNGAFHFAVNNNVPVLPMTFVFPKPKHVTLLVGKPIYPKDIAGEEELSKPKQVVKLAEYVCSEMQHMIDRYYSQLNEKGA